MPKTVSANPDGAGSVLKQNLTALMARHRTITNAKVLAKKAQLGRRTIGNIIGKGVPNPELSTIEAVAAVFHLEPWEILMPGLDVEKVIPRISDSEHQLHMQIEEAMRKLGIDTYKINPGSGR